MAPYSVMKRWRQKNKTGKGLLTVSDETELLAPFLVDAEKKNNQHWLVIITDKTRILAISAEHLNEMNKKGRGTRLVALGKEQSDVIEQIVLIAKMKPSLLLLMVNNKH